MLAVQGTNSDEVVERSGCRSGTTTCRSGLPTSTERGGGLPDRVHRRARLRAGGTERRRGRRSSTRCSRRGSGTDRAGRARRAGHAAHRDGVPAARPGHLAATSPRYRPGSAGRSAGRRTRSGVTRHCVPRRRPDRPGTARAARRRPGDPAPGDGRAGAGGDRSSEVTSGTFSPTLKKGVALALVRRRPGRGGRGDGGRPRAAGAVPGRETAVRLGPRPRELTARGSTRDALESCCRRGRGDGGAAGRRLRHP